LVGLFLARISRGRTIRQFAARTLTIPFIKIVEESILTSRRSSHVLKEMGFSPTSYVHGRASIADLFKPGEPCGLYVLHFADGEIYAGQALDVTRRYVQHRKVHTDIEKISFRQVDEDRLNDEERALIGELEQNGHRLRNIIFTSIPKGESDFDLVMPSEEQEQWLGDLGYAGEVGERLIDPELRRRYRRRFQRFLKMPRAEERSTSCAPTLRPTLRLRARDSLAKPWGVGGEVPERVAQFARIVFRVPHLPSSEIFSSTVLELHPSAPTRQGAQSARYDLATRQPKV